MDMRDDPNTTTTTDYDSGDSVGADYVYPSQRIVEKKHVKEHTKARSPARRRSPKAKARSSPRCTCGLDRSEDDDDHGNSTTVFEDESETEEDRCEKHKRPTKPRPSVHRGSACHHDVKEKLKADHKRRASETKSRRAQTPYVEEYPDEIPRPTVLLKEHRILRRASTTDAKRLRDLEGRSQSTGSRGRSPTGKRLPTRTRRRSPKESPKRHKRRLESHTQHESDKSSESDSRESKTDSNTDSGSPHRAPPEPEPRPTRLTRSKTWSGNTHSAYSSSWPLHAASRATHERSRRKDYDDDNESESDESDSSKYEQSRIVNIGKRREERHHSKQHVHRASRDYGEEDQSESRSSNYEQPRPSAGKHREERHHSKQHTRRTSRDYDDDDRIQSNSSDYDQPRGKHREERHHTKQHVRRTSRDYDDGDDKSENASSDFEQPRATTGKHREERHHAKQHVRRMSKEYTPREYVPDQERRRERQHTREEGRRHTREDRQTQHHVREKERDRSPSRSPSPPSRPSRLRTVASRSSMTTIDQGYSRSVATSLCEVWRGHAADWESPYVSPTDSDLEESDLDDDGQPVRLLGMDDISTRSESPRLLPARGDRSEVSVRARDHYHLPLTTCTDSLPLPPTSVQRSQTWPAPPHHHHHHHHPYVLDNGLSQPLTAEPDAMTDDGPAAGALIPRRPSSRASSLWPSGQDPSPSRFRRSVTHPLPTHGSRAAAVTSSARVFAARRTREFLSPRPTRAAEARFDFRAWECFSWG